MKKLVSVFGPSNIAPNSELYRDAERLGQLLAANHYHLVAGGFEGVMEAVAKGAKEAGGNALGVIGEVYRARGRNANEYMTRELHVKSANDQISELVDLGDAYIVLGTAPDVLLSVMIAWDYMLERFITEKLLILVGATWQRFTEYLAQEKQLADTRLLRLVSSIDEAIELLNNTFGPQLDIPDLNVLIKTD